MFLKQEKPEIDDFERKKKTLVRKNKYLSKFLTNTLEKS